MTDHPYRSSTDPRRNGNCMRCGKPRVEHTRVTEFDARHRDTERLFFESVVTLAQRMTGITNPGYVGRVKDRLALGRRRYGDGAFMDKDVLQEVLDETPDIAGYAILELHKQRHLELEGSAYERLFQDLVAASAYGCVADFYAQRAARRLHGATA